MRQPGGRSSTSAGAGAGAGAENPVDPDERAQRSPDAHQALVAEGRDGHPYEVSIEGWQQRAEPGQVELLVVVTDGSLLMGIMPVVWRAQVRRR